MIFEAEATRSRNFLPPRRKGAKFIRRRTKSLTNGSTLNLRSSLPLHLCGRYSEYRLRLCRSGSFVVNICLPTFTPFMALRKNSSLNLHLSSVVIGFTFHMFRQYSRMERSEEKRPTRALLRIDMRVQFF